MAGTKPAPAPGYKPRCRTCGTQWTGLNVAHCGACHETFTSPTAFDAHRFGDRCGQVKENQGGNSAQYIRSDGRELPFLRNADNRWHYPGRPE